MQQILLYPYSFQIEDITSYYVSLLKSLCQSDKMPYKFFFLKQKNNFIIFSKILQFINVPELMNVPKVILFKCLEFCKEDEKIAKYYSTLPALFNLLVFVLRTRDAWKEENFNKAQESLSIIQYILETDLPVITELILNAVIYTLVVPLMLSLFKAKWCLFKQQACLKCLHQLFEIKSPILYDYMTLLLFGDDVTAKLQDYINDVHFFAFPEAAKKNEIEVIKNYNSSIPYIGPSGEVIDFSKLSKKVNVNIVHQAHNDMSIMVGESIGVYFGDKAGFFSLYQYHIKLFSELKANKKSKNIGKEIINNIIIVLTSTGIRQ